MSDKTRNLIIVIAVIATLAFVVWRVEMGTRPPPPTPVVPTVAPSPTTRLPSPIPTTTPTGIAPTPTPTLTVVSATPSPTISPTTPRPTPIGAIPAPEATRFFGQRKTVCGLIVRTFYAQSATGRPTFFDMGALSPDPTRLSVLIWDNNRAKFSQPPEQYYLGKVICVNGVIELYQGAPEIVVADPSQIIEL